MSKAKTDGKKQKLPEMFRPLLWGLRFEEVEPWRDRHSIIIAAMTNGHLAHVRWIIDTYGKKEIRKELSRRLETELHSGARNLARVLFDVSKFKHAR